MLLRFRLLRLLLRFRRCSFAQDPGRRDGEGRDGRRHDRKRGRRGDVRDRGSLPRRLDAHPHGERDARPNDVPPDRGLGGVGVEDIDGGGEEALHGAGGCGQREQGDGGRAEAEDQRDDGDQCVEGFDADREPGGAVLRGLGREQRDDDESMHSE